MGSRSGLQRFLVKWKLLRGRIRSDAALPVGESYAVAVRARIGAPTVSPSESLV